MNDQLESLDSSDLDRVTGGAKPSTGAGFMQGAKKVTKGLAKGFPLANAGFAAFDAYQGYSTARSKGASFGGAMKEAGLEGLNSYTWGASNYMLGRE